mmetsp:Transcript_13/g.18  ORF Transcript_13/g.18 Transcript_13/m.18 type:complete len:187 (-) Transcript_13:1112-1672(-)
MTRPFTSSVIENREEREIHHRLVVAENLMRQLYRRNKLLEENLSRPELERLERESKLAEELREKSEENESLQLQITDLQQRLNMQPSDSYVEFLEERVKDTLEESKRHLHNYATTKRLLMTNLKASGSDDSIIKQLKEALAQEAAAREKERQEYEANIGKWRELSSEYFVEKKQLLEQIDTLKTDC